MSKVKKFKDDNPYLIENILRIVVNKLGKKGKEKWLDNETFQFTKGKELLGKIRMNDKEINYEGREAIKLIDRLIKKVKTMKSLRPEDVSKTVFKNMFDYKEKFNGLDGNPLILKLLDKKFKELGIEVVTSIFNLKRNATINKKITLVFDTGVDGRIKKEVPPGFYTRMNDLLYNKYGDVTDIPNKEEFKVVYEAPFISPFEGEKIIDIKIGNNILIGRYFKERNLIRLYYNPFLIRKILPLQTEISKPLKDLFAVLKSLKPVKTNITTLQKKIFISGFLKRAREKLEEIKQDKKRITRDISSNENNIRLLFDRLNRLEQEKIFISNTINTSGKTIFNEVNKVKKLPFVDEIDLQYDGICIKFKPATITIPNFKRSDMGKKLGKRICYLGWIEIVITPDGFKVKGETDIDGHPHPHADSHGGTPCFGSGDGRNKIYECLSFNKFVDLATLLWFWIKTYRNEGAYVKIWDFYDNRLQHGYPIWDEKGNRIMINDKDRIKTGEQRKLMKADDYNINIKKFKGMKVF